MANIYDYNGEVVSLSSSMTKVADVTVFGAAGDGTTDDSTSIQNAIDSVQTGGIVYFPYGIYKVNTAVKFYSNQRLVFAKGATLLLGANVTSPNIMRNYNTSEITGYNGTHDVIIDGATFDGNSITGNSPTLLGFSHSYNIRIINCHFKRARGSWHDLEINSSKLVKVIGCTFDGGDKTAENGENIQIDKAGSSQVYPWTCNYDDTVCEDI